MNSKKWPFKSGCFFLTMANFYVKSQQLSSTLLNEFEEFLQEYGLDKTDSISIITKDTNEVIFQSITGHDFVDIIKGTDSSIEDELNSHLDFESLPEDIYEIPDDTDPFEIDE